MKRLTEGRKMFITVLAIFIFYGGFFIIFDDFDRRIWMPLSDTWSWHLLGVGVLVLIILAFVLHRYAHRMDERISREQAEKADQLRRELTQNIAHELKTPLASILGYSETLLNNPDIDPDTRQQFIERTHSQAQRLSSLFQDIATLNRMDSAPEIIAMDRVNVSVLFSDIVQEIQRALQNHDMTLRNCLPASIIVTGNESLLYSVFRNLINNSIKYAGDGISIELTAEEHTTYWQFTYSDTGIGVPPDNLPHLFERFYRVDKGRSRKLGGSGLGLAIVRNAIQLHGGTITAESNIPHGLKFVFTLNKTI